MELADINFLTAGPVSTVMRFVSSLAIYLSVDTDAVGYPGCKLSATVVLDPDGRSAPYILGRVIRVPRLDKFALTSEKVGDASYAGTVDGHDLDVIEKVGRDATNGLRWTPFRHPCRASTQPESAGSPAVAGARSACSVVHLPARRIAAAEDRG